MIPRKRDILDFLKRIEHSEVSLTPGDEPQALFAGTVEYDADNSWRIGIFNDVNQWDYIEWIATDSGERLDFKDLDKIDIIYGYEPSEEIAWLRYEIPGYMQYRCKSCGRP